jgi:hypothetical protein
VATLSSCILYALLFVAILPGKKKKERRESDENGLRIPAMLLRQTMTTTWKLECIAYAPGILSLKNINTKFLLLGFFLTVWHLGLSWRQGGFGMKKKARDILK